MELPNWRGVNPNRGYTYFNRYVVIHGLDEGCGIQIFSTLLHSNIFPLNAFQIEIFGHRWHLSHIIEGDSLHKPSLVYKCFHPICSARIIFDPNSCFPSGVTTFLVGTHEHRPHAPASPWEPIIIMTYEVFHSDLRRRRYEILNGYIRLAACFAHRTITSPGQPLNSHSSISGSNFFSPHSYGTPRSGHGRTLILDGFPTQNNTTVDTSLTLRTPSADPATMVRGESSSHGPHQIQQHGPLGVDLNQGNGIAPFSQQASSSNELIIQSNMQLQQMRSLAQLFDSHRQRYERSSSSSAIGEGGGINPEAHNTEFHGNQTENQPEQQRKADSAEPTV